MKRNHIKAILVFMLALMLCISQVGAAFAAEGLVDFEWSADKKYHLTFTGNSANDGTNYGMTDLFPDLKEVIPGDQLTQKVVITNKTGTGIRVYMVAAPSVYDDNYGDWEENSIVTNGKHKELRILDYMSMTVDLVKGKRVFETLHDPANLTRPVYLATLGKNGQVELEVNLDVSIEMPSSETLEDGTVVDYMDAMATIPWKFFVEELPEEDTPDTGDWFSMPVWIGLGVVLAAALVWLLVGWKKRKEA